MKKKLLALALTTAMLGSCMIAVPAQAENLVTSGYLTFDTDTGTLIECSASASGSVTIPGKIEGTAVTSIGEFAFIECSSLTSVTIPNSVTSIGEYAFVLCSSLTSITIPDSVTSIGEFAFGDCSSLTSVTIPDSVTSIDFEAFIGCSSLTSVNVSGNNNAYTSKDGVLFDKDMETIICCPGGKTGEYVIPDSVTSIGYGAFTICSSLTSVTIPDSVTSIGYRAFDGCSSLTSVTIPDSVTSIGDAAFIGCSSLTCVTIPDSVTSIGDFAFYGCSKLSDIYYTGTSEQWIRVNKKADWKNNCPAKIYVSAPTTKTATVDSDKTYAYKSPTDLGATGFSATIEADDTPYVLGDVIWSVTSMGVSKNTAPLSYGNITISSGAVCIGLVVRGLYDPYATATATYEKIVSDYTEYIE